MRHKNSKQIRIWIDNILCVQIDEMARKKNIPRNRMIEYLIRRGQENIILSETHQEVIQIKNDLIEIRKNQKNQSNMLGLKLMKIEKLLFDIYKQIILVTFALYRYVEKRINKDEFTQYIANVKQRAEKYMKGEEK